MDANSLVVLCTTNNPAEAELIKSLLETEGIRCELEGENQAALTGILAIKVWVRAWDEDKARRVLKERSQHHEAEHGSRTEG
jgi:Putative prokaryotic signal transducing protein